VVTPFIGPFAMTASVFNSAATNETVAGLINGATYTFKVAATNGNGTGPQSVASSAVKIGVPVAPTAVWAVPGNAQATVSWTAPANTNGSPIKGYVVMHFIGVAVQPS